MEPVSYFYHMAFLIFYITHPSEKVAQEISATIVQEKLAACSNILPIQSMYWWQGSIQNEGEWVSILKTTEANKDRMMERVEQLHPYEVPCILFFKVEANAAYEKWIRDSVL